MSDLPGNAGDRSADTGTHGHVPADPDDGVVRARPPAPSALLLTAVAAALTVLALLAFAVVSGQGT